MTKSNRPFQDLNSTSKLRWPQSNTEAWLYLANVCLNYHSQTSAAHIHVHTHIVSKVIFFFWKPLAVPTHKNVEMLSSVSHRSSTLSLTTCVVLKMLLKIKSAPQVGTSTIRLPNNSQLVEQGYLPQNIFSKNPPDLS